MHRPRHRIQWQLTFYMGCVICVLLMVFLQLDRVQQRERLINSRASHMMQETRLVRMAMQHEPDPDRRDDFLERYCATMRFHGQPGHSLAVADPSGLFHSAGRQLSREDVMKDERVQRVLSSDETAESWVDRDAGGRRLIVVHSYRPPNATKAGIVYYSESLDDIYELSQMLFLQRAGMALLLLAAVVVVIWLFVRYKVSLPLNALLTREYAASKGDLRLRPYPDPHNEISELHDMFNIMLKKIEQREKRLRGPGEAAQASDLVAWMEDELAGLSYAVGQLDARSETLSVDGRRLLDEVHISLADLRRALTQLGHRLNTSQSAVLHTASAGKKHSGT